MKDRVKDREFDHCVVTELEAVTALIAARKAALIQEGQLLAPDGMARFYALGAVDNAIWALLQRARGTR